MGSVRSKGMTISEWFYEGIITDGGILAIDSAYFTITGGRERWLYRVARKHARGADTTGFAISLPTLFEKSGAEGIYRRFKFEMLAIARENTLPEYAWRVEQERKAESILRMVSHKAIGNDLSAITEMPPEKRRSRLRN